jgi:hypothetical protein
MSNSTKSKGAIFGIKKRRERERERERNEIGPSSTSTPHALQTSHQVIRPLETASHLEVQPVGDPDAVAHIGLLLQNVATGRLLSPSDVAGRLL